MSSRLSATEASARVIAAVSALPLAAALFGGAATTQKQVVGGEGLQSERHRRGIFGGCGP